jgi:hypothetical protein
MLNKMHEWNVSDDPVLTALNDGVRAFLSPEQKTTFQRRVIDNLKQDPRTISELLHFSRSANVIYEEIMRGDARSHRLDIGRPAVIDVWKRDLQFKLYDCRDRLLQADPTLLAHFTLSRQYTHVAGPENQVPLRLQHLDQQLGTVLFTARHVKSDCGLFANQLFEKLKALAIDEALLTLKGDLTRDETVVSREHVRTIADLLKSVNRVNVDYAEALCGNRRVKTQIAADGRGMIITLEAHADRPFALAPEVCVYRNRHEFTQQPTTPAPARAILYEMNGMDEIAPMVPVGHCGQRALRNLTNNIHDNLQAPLGVNHRDFASSPEWRSQLVDSILDGKVRQIRAIQSGRRALLAFTDTAQRV